MARMRSSARRCAWKFDGLGMTIDAMPPLRFLLTDSMLKVCSCRLRGEFFRLAAGLKSAAHCNKDPPPRKATNGQRKTPAYGGSLEVAVVCDDLITQFTLALLVSCVKYSGQFFLYAREDFGRKE